MKVRVRVGIVSRLTSVMPVRTRRQNLQYTLFYHQMHAATGDPYPCVECESRMRKPIAEEGNGRVAQLAGEPLSFTPHHSEIQCAPVPGNSLPDPSCCLPRNVSKSIASQKVETTKNTLLAYSAPCLFNFKSIRSKSEMKN